jgi:hypothetical protein
VDREENLQLPKSPSSLHQILEQQPHSVKLLPHENRTPESEPHLKKKVCVVLHIQQLKKICARQRSRRRNEILFVQDKVVEEAAAVLENLLL